MHSVCQSSIQLKAIIALRVMYYSNYSIKSNVKTLSDLCVLYKRVQKQFVTRFASCGGPTESTAYNCDPMLTCPKFPPSTKPSSGFSVTKYVTNVKFL